MWNLYASLAQNISGNYLVSQWMYCQLAFMLMCLKALICSTPSSLSSFLFCNQHSLKCIFCFLEMSICLPACPRPWGKEKLFQLWSQDAPVPQGCCLGQKDVPCDVWAVVVQFVQASRGPCCHGEVVPHIFLEVFLCLPWWSTAICVAV